MNIESIIKNLLREKGIIVYNKNIWVFIKRVLIVYVIKLLL